MAAEGYRVQEDSEMIFNYYGGGGGGAMVNSSVISNTIIPATGIAANSSSPSSSISLTSSSNRQQQQQDNGLASDWTLEEQYKLKEGLQMYANEPSIMKYIKIAAYLRDKTVRDVAVRCRWMTSKRRKPEDHNVGKKPNNRKDKLLESSSNTNMPSPILHNMLTYPLILHQMDQNERMLFQGISGTTRHLLEQNSQDFDQIRDNLSIYRLQDNIDLFYRTRNNIAAILIDMRETPGIMSQMPPLPVSINDDLANTLLPSTTQMIFGGIQLKQEPRC